MASQDAGINGFGDGNEGTAVQTRDRGSDLFPKCERQSAFRWACWEFIDGVEGSGSCFARMPTSQNRDMGHPALEFVTV
jgi:hypothetical protein